MANRNPEHHLDECDESSAALHESTGADIQGLSRDSVATPVADSVSRDADRSSRKNTINVLDADMMANMTISAGTFDCTCAAKELASDSSDRRDAEGNSVSAERGLNHQST